MRSRLAILIAFAIAAFDGAALVRHAAAQGNPDVAGAAEQKLVLTPAQRNAIYAVVSKDRGKVAPQRFATTVGADVPPMIELYALPDDAVADNPAAKLYKYTVVQDQVVLVDPTKMRVVDVIGPSAGR